MLRQLCAAILATVPCWAASATTLSVSPDKFTYSVGETVTLTVTGDDGGVTAFGIFGRLDYNGALVDNGTRSQTWLVDSSGSWIRHPLDAGDTHVNSPTSAFSEAFSQISLDGKTADNLPGTLATVTLIAAAIGIVDANWHTAIDGNQLTFFGLSSDPGTSFTIVPEPTTITLLVAGLVGLAGWRRSRA